jgi:hypothetical protein
VHWRPGSFWEVLIVLRSLANERSSIDPYLFTTVPSEEDFDVSLIEAVGRQDIPPKM